MSTTKVADSMLESGFMKSTDGVLSGTITGTYTLAGTPTITNPTLSTPTITGGVASADPTAALGLSTKQYVDKAAQQNPIINGNMEIWQRGPGPITGNNYSADRWTVNASGTATWNLNRSTNVPTIANAGVLFNYSLELDVTVADAAVTAGDIWTVVQRVEGYNWRHFAQRNITISFWVMSSKTGIHCLALLNGGGAPDRSYVAEYTINVADTWEFKTLNILASPSAGTWNYTTGIGVVVAFVLGSSTTYHTTAGTWQTGIFYATSSQVNVLDNVANFFRVTGVKMELGSEATPIQFVPFEEELARCQRYYQKSFNYATAPAQNAGSITGEATWPATAAGAVVGNSPAFPFMVPLRVPAALATVTTYNRSAANIQARNITDGADLTGTSMIQLGEKSFYFTYTGTAGTAVGEILVVHWSADAEL